jgi:hypothetical protein
MQHLVNIEAPATKKNGIRFTYSGV